MANLEQFGILKQGVSVWNKWRIENPNTSIDLSGIDLPGGNLIDVNCKNANLISANLNETNLGNTFFLEST